MLLATWCGQKKKKKEEERKKEQTITLTFTYFGIVLKDHFGSRGFFEKTISLFLTNIESYIDPLPQFYINNTYYRTGFNLYHIIREKIV